MNFFWTGGGGIVLKNKKNKKNKKKYFFEESEGCGAVSIKSRLAVPNHLTLVLNAKNQ